MSSEATKNVLHPREPLISGVSDFTLSLIIPVITHWITAAIYGSFELFGLFQDCRIHTSKEESTKNSISRRECLRGVILVQILQTGLGLFLGFFSETEVVGNENDDLTIWAGRVRTCGQGTLYFLQYCGLEIDAPITGVPRLYMHQEADLWIAKIIYYGLMPFLRFYAALRLADTWVFFIHRIEHSNQWLYRKFHARHHELNVPYSWGGIYDHPVESLFLSVGAYAIGVLGSGMSLRESMFFSAFSSVKTCTDHGGYHFPWNPIDLFTTVGAAYHDKHHQRWGVKNNYALHFRLWDSLFGTEFTDSESAARLYSRDRMAAEIGQDTKKER